MTDALMIHGPDGGDIELINGQVRTSNGLYTAVYLALFGGNEADSGDDAEDRLQWWGNFTEPDESRHYRSRTQHVLQGLPATTGNLKRLREAIEADLGELVSDETLAEFSARVTMTAPKRIRIEIQVVANGEDYPFAYETAWEA